MTTSIEDGSRARFRTEASAIRDQADWHTLVLLGTASLAVTLLFSVLLLRHRPDSPLLWPNLAGCLGIAATLVWTHRTRRMHAAIAVLTSVMMVGICGVILVQRGSHAPAVVYGLTTVAVVFIAGRARLGAALALALTVWTAVVTWAAAAGRLHFDTSNPLGDDNARLLAQVVAVVLVGLAARIAQRRRTDLDLLLDRAVWHTERERDEAQRLAERRARMVAEISHEIRTPMTGIVGAAQLLARHAISPLQRQLLSVQRQSAERLLSLVGAVLDEAKADSAPTQVRHEPCAIRDLVAEVCELFAPQAHRKGLEIVWTAGPSLPAQLLGDAVRLRQIASNLVSNAVKFSTDGAVQVHLDGRDGARWRLVVSDSGRGIAPDRLEAIFERFVSDAPHDEHAHSTGLGLPICRDLAHLLGGDITVQSRPGQGSRFTLTLPCHGAPGSADEVASRVLPAGRLWVVGASAPLALQLRAFFDGSAVDARFLDRLPFDHEWAGPGDTGGAHEAVLVDVWAGHGGCATQLPALLDAARRHGRQVIAVNPLGDDAAPEVQDGMWQAFRPLRWAALRDALAWAFTRPQRGAPVPAAGGPALRVLLVDDNAVNQMIGKAMLEVLGAEVLTVDSGHAALDALAAQAYDLVLMDLQMPGLDGLETTRRLRRAEAGAAVGQAARVPVVAITGLADSATEGACREAGLAAVLIKPYTVDQMRQVLDTHARRVPA